MDLSNPVLALLSLILALLVACMTGFAYLTSNYNRLKDVMIAKIDALGERESKQRHDLRNELQTLLTRQDSDITVTQRNVDEVMRDVVRRADIVALRTEIMQVLGEFKAEYTRTIERSDGATRRTLERLGERVEALSVRIARLPGAGFTGFTSTNDPHDGNGH